MYLSNHERTGVLVELIVKLLKLVEEGKMPADAAFHAVVEQAKEHTDWPAPELPTAKALLEPPQPPVAVPVDTTTEDIPL